MKDIIDDLLDCRGRLHDVIEEMGALEERLMGMEFLYQGNYASIMFADGNRQETTLYVEDEEGENWETVLSLQEVLDLVQ